MRKTEDAYCKLPAYCGVGSSIVAAPVNTVIKWTLQLRRNVLCFGLCTPEESASVELGMQGNRREFVVLAQQLSSCCVTHKPRSLWERGERFAAMLRDSIISSQMPSRSAVLDSPREWTANDEFLPCIRHSLRIGTVGDVSISKRYVYSFFEYDEETVEGAFIQVGYKWNAMLLVLSAPMILSAECEVYSVYRRRRSQVVRVLPTFFH